MSLLLRLRDAVGMLPPSAGRILARVPYSWRLGSAFDAARRDIDRFAGWGVEEQKAETARRISEAVRKAGSTTTFYRDHYERRGFHPAQGIEFDDIAKIPLVTKDDLQAVPLPARTTPRRGAILTNTGGSSGKPLAFYLDRQAFAREWAHMLCIWNRIGYNPTDLKLTFRGKNLGDAPVRYNAVYNEFYVNAYCSNEARAQAVAAIAHDIRVLHGYPSSIYDFVRYCAERAPDVLGRLRRGLKGVLLASEFPAPVYRDLIEGELGVPSVSWYGHSEMAVLAYEIEKYVYVPFQSYGYAEAVSDTTGAHRLVATSYYNLVSPFIRYDTEDLIAPEWEDGLLARFRIEGGRQGEFVEDAKGNRISLTALVFGRHHALFGRAHFMQVRQTRPGEATIIVSAPEGTLTEEEIRAGFDASHVDMAFTFETRTEPIRTPGGKVPLRVG